MAILFKNPTGKKTKAKPYKEPKKALLLVIAKSIKAEIPKVGYRGVYTAAE